MKYIKVFFLFVIFLVTLNTIASLENKNISDINTETNDSLDLIEIPLVVETSNLKDCVLENSTLQTMSDDSWVIFNLDTTLDVQEIHIHIEEMNVEKTNAMIFWDDTDDISGNYYVQTVLNCGENVINLQDAKARVFRIDFSDQKDDIIQLGNIYVKGR